MCSDILCSSYKIGLIKSILIDLRGQTLTSSDTYAALAEKGKGQYNKNPFIGVPYNVGSTTHQSKNKKVIATQQRSFGCPRRFFRFSFTSAIYHVPYAYVDWAAFKATTFHRTTFEGNMTKREWETGPRTRSRSLVNPFVPCDHFMPSRFVLAYETNLNIAFISLDAERIGDDIISDAKVTDFGDNILQYMGGDPDEDRQDGLYRNIPSNLRKFMTSDLS
jgi:hypothetical protein